MKKLIFLLFVIFSSLSYVIIKANLELDAEQKRNLDLIVDNDVLKNTSNDCKVQLLNFQKDTEELKQLEKRVNQEKYDIENRLKQSENELVAMESKKNFIQLFELKSKQDLVIGLKKQILDKDEEIGKLKTAFTKLKALQTPPLHTIPSCPTTEFGTKFPITPIHSFPGSGNTWLRHLIETATGFWTGSMYMDDDLFRGGMKGEMTHIADFPKVIGVKVHDVSGTDEKLYNLVKKQTFSKCVIMIRNPFEAIVSEFTRFTTGGHSAGFSGVEDDEIRKKFNAPENGYIRRFYDRTGGGLPGRWLTSNEGAVKNCMNTDGADRSMHLMFYEQLKRDTIGEMRKLAKYLESYDEARFHDCIEVQDKHGEGNFHRKNHLEVNLFDKEAAEKIRAMVMKLNETVVLPASYLVNPFE